VRNSGSATIDLDGYRLWSAPHVYPFPRATLLAPGASLRVDTVGDPDENEPDFLHWGNPGPILNDRGDTVRLTNLRGVQLDCFAYGAATC
jgi:hypothetical protein